VTPGLIFALCHSLSHTAIQSDSARAPLVSAILSKIIQIVRWQFRILCNNRIIWNLTTKLKSADPESSWGVIYCLPLRNLIFSRHLRISKNWIQKYPKLGTNFVRFSRMSISPQRMWLRMALRQKIKPRGSLQKYWYVTCRLKFRKHVHLQSWSGTPNDHIFVVISIVQPKILSLWEPSLTYQSKLAV
jgi:hypothetical protein